jgi:hypothetical protein
VQERAQPVTLVVAERLAQNPSSFHETSERTRVRWCADTARAAHVCAVDRLGYPSTSLGDGTMFQGIVKPLNTHVTPAVTPMLGSRDVIPKINPASARTVDRV